MEEPLTNGLLADANGSSEPALENVTNGHSESKKEHSGEKKDRDKEHRSHSSSSSKHHSSSSSGHKSSHRPKSEHRDKDGHRSSSSHKSSHGDKDRSSSSSKHHSSSSSHKSSHKDKHRDKERSSSSHKDGEKRSSGSSSSKHSHRDKDRSSSSSKHSSSHKSSHSDRDKHKSSSSSGKPRSSESKPKTEVKTEPMSPTKIKTEPKAELSDDDVPLTARLDTSSSVKAEKRSIKQEDSDDEPLADRMEKKKVKKEEKTKKRKTEDEEDDDFTPLAKKKKKKEVKKEPISPQKGMASPQKGRKKGKQQEEEKTVWKWWEEEEKPDGVKWNFLEHKGPVFAPPYEPLPDDVHFYYDGKVMKLSENAEEVGGFYGRMLDHDYVTKQAFNDNFFKDWRKVMTSKEREIIKDLSRCNFKEIDVYYKQKSEERKAMSKDEKKKIKEANEELMKEYGFCTMDGHTEKIGNFKIEPPGLFRGRGDHPKMGSLKRRVMPEDILINCSKNSVIPVAPKGHRWKEVRHDNSVTWLVSWTENIQNQTKYIMLAPTSKLKGAKDWKKYEKARELHTKVDKIRAAYREDLKSKEMRIRQRAVAMYFIDKLALRAGNEKDGEETADTVGCCSLRFEHLKLHDEMDGKPFMVEFDFLGKDSIRYYNKVPVDKRVYKNLKMFMENKNEGDDLFDRLNTAILNKHLNTLMDGLTAKVFRTYNASRTLQEQLDLLTIPEDTIPAKILAYNRANRSVAILCNHQRAVPKTFDKQMENLNNKIEAKKEAIHNAKKEYKASKGDFKAMKSEKTKTLCERKKKAVERLEDQLGKLEIALTDKDENKEIALGTSKLNYLDPRISVAWCKKWEVPMEKVYNKTQRDKFAWAIDMAESDYKFTEFD